MTFLWLFIFEEWCECTFKSNKQKYLGKFFFFLLPSWRSLTKRAGSGTVSQRYGSAEPDPDQYQNVTDLCWTYAAIIACYFIVYFNFPSVLEIFWLMIFIYFIHIYLIKRSPYERGVSNLEKGEGTSSTVQYFSTHRLWSRSNDWLQRAHWVSSKLWLIRGVHMGAKALFDI